MRQLIGLIFIFIFCSLLLFTLWSLGPLPEGAQRPKFPRDLNGLRELSSTLAKYEKNHATYTVALFSAAYLYKQTFAIPGSFFMNLLSGALFGTLSGTLLVASLNCIGASLCFILSSLFAKSLVEKFFKNRIENLRIMINSERDRLWMFLLSARIFPFTPHWLINISSPFLNVPLYTHATSVFVGLLPYNLLCVRAGTVLADIHSMGDVFDFWTLSELFSVSLLLLIVARVSKRKRNTVEKMHNINNNNDYGLLPHKIDQDQKLS